MAIGEQYDPNVGVYGGDGFKAPNNYFSGSSNNPSFNALQGLSKISNTPRNTWGVDSSGEFVDMSSLDYKDPGVQGSSIDNAWGNNSNSGLNTSSGLGLNMGTLQLGTAMFQAYNGYQQNKRAGEANETARQELAQNAKSFDINAGMQLATLQNEETRRNAYAGGFLDNSQRSDRFKDYDLQKLSVAGA